MEIQVTKDNVCISNDQLHTGEFNVNPLHFNFSAEYTDDLVKKVVFSTTFGEHYSETIINNVATIPYEVLDKQESVLIGVYAYEVEDEELVLRYSPAPMYVDVQKGSYIDAQDGTILIPALTVEQYEQELNEIITKFDFDKDYIINDIVTTSEDIFEDYYDRKKGDFDTNATDKTNTFNSNATSKTSTYNTNATNKTNTFNQNATDKTNAFNQNVIDKTAEFDQHATGFEGTWRGTQAEYDALTKDNNTQYYIEEVTQ